MKRLLTTIAILLISLTGFTQLNTEAEVLREEEPEQYNNIRCYATKKWGDDNQMIVHTINKQAKSLVTLLKVRDEELVSGEFVGRAMEKWKFERCDGYNWRMVLHEVKEQIENSDY